MHPRLRALANTMAPRSLLFAILITASATATAAVLKPLAVEAPESPVAPNSIPACTSPAPVHTSGSFHCYTPADIAAAYGVDKLHAAGLMGHPAGVVFGVRKFPRLPLRLREQPAQILIAAAH